MTSRLWGAGARGQDAVAVIVLAVTVTEIARSTFGLPAGPAAVGFVAIWLAQAVRRVIDWQRGDAPARDLDTGDLSQMLTLMLGLVPWTVLPMLHGLHPGWPAWAVLAFPGWLRATGALIGVLTALAATARRRPGAFTGIASSTGMFPSLLSPDAQLFALSMLLVSGSPLVALIAAYWLAAHGGVWLAARGSSRPHRVPAVSLEPNW